MSTVSVRETHAIDVHTHPFSVQQDPFVESEFIQKLSSAVVPNQLPNGYIQAPKQPFPVTNMWMQILINRLADYYCCNRSLYEVVKQRNEMAKNVKSYTRGLFADAGISGVVADFGYPSKACQCSKIHDVS